MASPGQPTLPIGITDNGDGTYSGTVMRTTLNGTNFPGLFNSPIIRTVKASGGDYTNLQDAFNAIGTDAPNCNEIIIVDSGYVAQSVGTHQQLTYQYACPAGQWVWVRPSNYGALPSQDQTICTTAITAAQAGGGAAIFTTSRNHMLTAGATVRVKGVSNFDFNGDYVVQSVPSANTFTVANSMVVSGASSSGGTVIPMNLYLNPSACPDLSNMFTVAKTGGDTYDVAVAINDNATGGVSSQGLILSGMNVAISPTATTYQGITIGPTLAISNSNYANNIILDRCYMAAPANTNFARGVNMLGPNQALVDSYIDGVKDLSGFYAETHTVVMPWAPGPYKIVNNYIGGVPTENIFSGGLAVPVVNAIPNDIEIRANTIFSDYLHPANSLSRKNLIEFKASVRLLIDGNTLEYSWNSARDPQYGSAFVLNTVESDPSGTNTWITNQDITFTNNDVQHFGSHFLLLNGRSEFQFTPSYPLDTRVRLANNVFRDWNQQTYNLNLGGVNSGGFAFAPGYFDATHPASGPDYTTLWHNGFYSSPGNNNWFGAFSNFWNLGNTGACPWSSNFTKAIPMPDFTVHANITVIDLEFAGDCEQTFDGFNQVAGFFPNVNWTGNVHVQNGGGASPNFVSGGFTTAGPDNQFPNAGASGAAPAGMFNNYSGCVAVPAGPLTSCSLQPSSAYHNASYCDSADCGPNIQAIEIAQTRDNDEGATLPPAATMPPAPPRQLTVTIAGLAAGSYSDQIQIADSNASNSPQSVTVIFTVAPAPESMIFGDSGIRPQ